MVRDNKLTSSHDNGIPPRTKALMAVIAIITLIAILLGLMTLITFANVIARYVFNSNILWAVEGTVYLFAWLMEKCFPVLPGKAPFLTRSIVHLAEDWPCATEHAKNKLGYYPQKDWKIAMDEALNDLKVKNYPWPYLAQKYK